MNSKLCRFEQATELFSFGSEHLIAFVSQKTSCLLKHHILMGRRLLYSVAYHIFDLLTERRKKKSYAFYLCVFLRHLFFQRQRVYVSSDILEIVVRAKRQLLSLHERRVKEHKGESTSKRVSMGFNSYIEK